MKTQSQGSVVPALWPFAWSSLCHVMSCLIWTREIWCHQLNFRQPKTESTTKTSIHQTKWLSVLWASHSPFCLPLMSCLPQSGSIDVCCAPTCTLNLDDVKVDSFLPYCFFVQCCLLLGNHLSLATAPPQKPRSSHSRWKQFHLGWHLASGKRTGCAGQEFLPPNMLHLLHLTSLQCN